MAGVQRLVAYERVSTARQGASGLGLEAQRKAIDDFAISRGADVLARFTEVESGRRALLPPGAPGAALSLDSSHRTCDRDPRHRRLEPWR